MTDKDSLLLKRVKASDKKAFKELFYNFDVVAKELNINLNLRPQNLSKDIYLKLCKLYEGLNQ